MTGVPTTIRAWRVDSGLEPAVRIGVVLQEDAQQVVRMQLPDAQYSLRAEPHTLTLGPRTMLTIATAGKALLLSVGGQHIGRVPRVRLSPLVAIPLASNSGVLVRDLVAGRGFHWQRRIDQTLTGTLEVRPADGGVVLINELPVEDYLAGVITAEMSGACPAALLEAQCIVARAWLLAFTEPKHENAPFDRCNDDCCQRYQGTGDLSPAAIVATRATRGVVLLTPDGNTVLDANYSKSCGGTSELPRHVWGIDKPGVTSITDAPAGDPVAAFNPVTEANFEAYLDGDWLAQTGCYCSPNVVAPETIGRYLGRVDQSDNYFRWTKTYTRGELEDVLRAKVAAAASLAELRDLRVVRRGVSGRATELLLTWADAAGQVVEHTVRTEYQIRRALHPKFLYSSAFAVRLERDGGGHLTQITLRGAGWGHGAGMCQIGALGAALCGLDAATICKHYYPTAQLRSVFT